MSPPTYLRLLTVLVLLYDTQELHQTPAGAAAAQAELSHELVNGPDQAL